MLYVMRSQTKEYKTPPDCQVHKSAVSGLTKDEAKYLPLS